MAYNKKAPTGCTDSSNLHIKTFANGIANMFACSAQHYAWLQSDNPRVAEACLVDGITYDVKHLRLVKTYPADGLNREPQYFYFNVDPPLETDKNA